MSIIPMPEDNENLEFAIRYQPDMVMEGELDAATPTMKRLTLKKGETVHNLLGDDELPDLTSLQNDIGNAVMAAISSANTSGHMGAYSAVEGSTISDDEALAIADAINIGRFKALGLIISVSTGKIYAEPSEHLNLPIGTLSFVLPDYNGYFVGISMATDESTTDELYVPIIFVATWAVKVGEYPSFS